MATKADVFVDQFFALMQVVFVPPGLLVEKAAKSSPKDTRRKSDLKKQLKMVLDAPATHVYDFYKGLPNWAEIFHRNMTLKRTVITPKQVNVWIDACTVYLRLVGKKKGSSKIYIEIVDSLLDFLLVHVDDTDNALQGLVPREQVFSSHYERTADGKRYRLQDADCADRGPDEKTLRTRAVQRLPPSKTDSFRSTVGLSKSKEMLEENTDPFRPGQLAIWFSQSVFTPSSATFCRISGQYSEEDGTVAVYADWKEEDLRVANLTDLLPFHKEMIAFLGHPRTMQNLVADPVDEVFAEISQKVKAEANAFLEREGIDVTALQEVLFRANDEDEQSLSILDLPLLNKSVTKLQQLRDEPPTTFFESLDALGAEQVEAFVAKGLDLFEPMRDDAMKQLTDMKYHTIAVSRIQMLHGNCTSAIDALSLEKRLLMNGTRKNELSSWWLGAIERATDSFLTSIKFNIKAVPNDYIERRPDDMDSIMANLEVIAAVLNKEEDKYNVMGMVDTLKKEIYERINLFIKKAKIVLAEEFAMEGEVTVEAASKAYEEKKESLDSTVSKWIDGMVKDIEYLEEMQDMEDIQGKPAGSGGGLVLSNVVPISGLILSRFFRKENEVRTVIELWAPRGRTERAATMM